ncbi:MAG: glycosyltransferase [Tannerellaceae bacterium]|jgi:glycosyltransferase involved in cell wall biosynthesis|nr:glycosyltransferase [Tannerellaceae bacterium]
MEKKYSVIIPVYNRPAEVGELLDSLTHQTCKDFEVVIVEDGSTLRCDEVVRKYDALLSVRYFFKPNSGRSLTRNYGMERAQGDYFLFFDSDCILPEDYFQKVSACLEETKADCFGGPDKAHVSFSRMQKAVSHSMTSFLTTGGIRGGKKGLEKFVPRTFNMGFSRRVYHTVGGFKDMFGEDIDLSTRIRKAGFSVRLFPDAYVYHKRRINLKSFYRQVYVFGMARIGLYQLHPESLKLVHWLPACFVLGLAFLFLTSFICLWALLPAGIYLFALFVESWIVNRDLPIAGLSVITGLVQLTGYGTGFLNAFARKVILKQHIDPEAELKKYYKKKS